MINFGLSRYILLFLLVFYIPESFSQTSQIDGKTINNIQTAVPFLTIAPDARSAAMGEAGAAISADVNSIYWNPAKLAFIDSPSGISTSYSPWLRKLVSDIDLGYLSGYYKLDERNTVGGSLRYFSLGSILFVQNESDPGTQYSPNEFSIDGVFSRKFGENFSLGTAIRYIKSSLGSGAISSEGVVARPASAVAADVSAYFKKGTVIFGTDAELAFGANISNIGTKVSYSDGGVKYFLPTNLKLGTASTFMLDDLSRFTVTLDVNKLLVPTSPTRDADGNIISGKNPDRSVPSGIFGSFNDAPGGFSEEFRELSYSFGTEYWYNQQFAVRTGYYYEHPTKGDRQYLTIGSGLKYNSFNIDLAYLFASQQKSPLANTLRFSLIFNFEKR